MKKRTKDRKRPADVAITLEESMAAPHSARRRRIKQEPGTFAAELRSSFDERAAALRARLKGRAHTPSELLLRESRDKRH